MSPLDTLKISLEDLGATGTSTTDKSNDNYYHFEAMQRQHPSLSMHVALHKYTKKECCIFLSNTNSSWLAAQSLRYTHLPAWDCNCGMFAENGDVSHLEIPFSSAYVDISPRSDGAVQDTCLPDSVWYDPIGSSCYTLCRWYDPIGSSCYTLCRWYDPIGSSCYTLCHWCDPIGSSCYTLCHWCDPIGSCCYTL